MFTNLMLLFRIMESDTVRFKNYQKYFLYANYSTIRFTVLLSLLRDAKFYTLYTECVSLCFLHGDLINNKR